MQCAIGIFAVLLSLKSSICGRCHCGLFTLYRLFVLLAIFGVLMVALLWAEAREAECAEDGCKAWVLLVTEILNTVLPLATTAVLQAVLFYRSHIAMAHNDHKENPTVEKPTHVFSSKSGAPAVNTTNTIRPAHNKTITLPIASHLAGR